MKKEELKLILEEEKTVGEKFGEGSEKIMASIKEDNNNINKIIL